MSGPTPKVKTIPAGENFACVLAGHILSQSDGSPESIAHHKILLPTRRACRTLCDAFLHLNDGKPMILPQIMPFGDVEEQDLSLMMFGKNKNYLDIPPAISPMRRKFLLARLIRQIPEFTQSMDHALKLADSIAALLDQIIIEELDFKALHTLVPAEFANHWQITLDFLKIISEQWPNILDEQNMVDPAKRRNMLMDNLVRHWSDNPPDTPVIAAGSTGSVPATRRLMNVIAALPQGEIILPGLDRDMDEESWQVIEGSHPQHGLKQLLDTIGIDRVDVAILSRNKNERILLAGEMMRPAATSGQWKNFSNKGNIDEMLQGLQYYPCKNPQQEAQIIALIIREALEDKDKTIALISPDRATARRVIAACRRWDIDLDDSGGTKLTNTAKGQFILLALEALRQSFDPVAFLALLKHPLCRLGYGKAEYKSLIHKLELQILRNKTPLRSFEMMKTLAANKEYKALVQFLNTLEDSLHHSKMDQASTLPQMIEAHLNIVQKLADTDKEKGETILWSDDDGEALGGLFIELQDHAALIENPDPSDYEALLYHLMEQSIVRKSQDLHPNVSILGQLEGRMSSADLVILSGLNEETWPPAAKHDPWMSRMMRKDFGLPDPEKFIGLAAHDFVQGFCAKNVVITRPEQYHGAPSVPARWLARLDAVLQTCGKSLDDLCIHPYKTWLSMLDQPKDFLPCSRPEPKPPLSARPSEVSVTKIENWLRDPYTIYAYYSLNIRKLRPLRVKHDAALLGNILHKILDQFVRDHPLTMPKNAEELLLGYAQNTLIDFGLTEDEIPFWLTKFKSIIDWYIRHESNWRQDAKFLRSEARGKAVFNIGDNNFTLHCIADRIDLAQGGYVLIDYKSGGNFSAQKLSKGQLPQLPLEALILQHEGFNVEERQKAIEGKLPTLNLSYWIMTGRQGGGEIVEINSNIEITLETVKDGLTGLVESFQDLSVPYYAVPDLSNAPAYNDYEHLARLKEWAVLDQSEEAA